MSKLAYIAAGLGALLYIGYNKRSSMSNMAFLATQSAFGNLSSLQQKSLNEIVRAFETYGDGNGSKLAYIIATAWHESRLTPIKEVRAAQNTPLYNLQNNYWQTGYYGRGFVQLTWLENYRKMGEVFGVDLVNNPDLALQPSLAAKILVYGMYNGSFTGRKLSDYIKGSFNDFFNARRIINGLDRAGLINDYAIAITQYDQNQVT